MPLYEYKCEGCGDVFEIIQRFSDEPLTVHEKCGGPVHRLLSPSALKFKGSGWYITDYANSGSSKSSNGSNKEGDSSSSSSDSKGDSKSDSKAAGSSEKSATAAPAKSESSSSSSK